MAERLRSRAGRVALLVGFAVVVSGTACDRARSTAPGTEGRAALVGDRLDCATVAPPYDGLPMMSTMIGEEQGKVFDTEVKYLDAEARKAYVVEVADGKLVDAKGAPFDTTSGPEGMAIYSLDPAGTLYAATEQQEGIFHHSSFVAGDEVAAAGELRATAGAITLVNNSSGHYRPSDADADVFLCWLGQRGVDLSQVRYRAYDDDDGEGVPADTRVYAE